MRRFTSLFGILTFALFAVLQAATPAFAATIDTQAGTTSVAASQLAKLPITIRTSDSTVIKYFNATGKAGDTSLVSSTQEAALLPTIHTGKSVVVFSSWADGQKTLPTLVGKVGTVAYNPEHSSYTPTSEQNNLVATTKLFSAMAHRLGFLFAIVPDHGFNEQYGAQLAPLADLYYIQGQALETDLTAFVPWVTKMVGVVRAAAPHSKIYVQVTTIKGTPQQMYAAISRVSGLIDGIAVWSDPSLLTQLQSFVNLVRPTTSTTTKAALPPATSAQAYRPIR